MGAGVSTEGAPLTRVKCKNNLGVLFDHKAEEAFRAAATGPEETVPWPEADAYVKTRDERWRDPKHVLFQNLGMAHGNLGDNAKKRELLERALPIYTRTGHRMTKKCRRQLAQLASERLSNPPPDSRNSVTCVVS